jgi:hypothetical protein
MEDEEIKILKLLHNIPDNKLQTVKKTKLRTNERMMERPSPYFDPEVRVVTT